MVAETNGSELIRLAELKRLTGWADHYIDKLVAAQVLTVYRPPWKRGWRFFYRSEVQAILNPKV